MSGILVKLLLAPLGAPFLVGALGALFLMALLLAAGVGSAQPPSLRRKPPKGLEPEQNGPALETLDLTGARRIEWIAVGGGSWHEADNWSGGEVPGDTDVVVVAAPGSYEVVLDRDAVVGGLEMSGEHGSPTLALVDSTLTIRGPSRIGRGAELLLAGGKVAGAGDLEVAGHLRWSAGSPGGLATAHITPSGRLTVEEARALAS